MTINEIARVSDVVLVEELEEFNYCREIITVVSGTTAAVLGQVLGQITASGKYAKVTPGAVDGSQIAAAVLLQAVDATAGDKTALAIVRGPAIFKDAGLAWTTGMTEPQKTTAKGQLATAGMPVRSALGA